MDITKGWIKLYRDIQDHWLWLEKPFDRRSAWLDILLSANHQVKKVPLGNKLVEVKRGQFITSEPKLAERWGWSRTKIRAFLKLLESDNMIVKKPDSKKTMLTVVNYSVYQVSETTEKQQKNSRETEAEQGKDNVKTGKEQDKNIKKTTEEHQKNTNKKEKNNNTIITIDESANVFKYYELNMGQLLSPVLIDKLNSYIDIMGNELVKLAIDKSVENNKRSYAYVETILKSWLNNGYKTKQQIIDADIKRKEQSKKRYKSNSNTKQSKFINYDQRTYNFDDLEKKAMELLVNESRERD